MKISKVDTPGFEEVVTCRDNASGLNAVIAVHSTKLGPALGGIRMHRYRSDQEAVEDAKRLAKAMSYKAAASDLKLGGGKAVINANPETQKSRELFEAMGRFVEKLDGQYLAAKDAGVTTDDLVQVSEATKYVTGLPEGMGGSGDPSPWTAQGILAGLHACLKETFGQSSCKGRTVTIQGVGHVGFELIRLLHAEGADLIATDTHLKRIERAKNEFGAKTVPCDVIHLMACDVFSPCAMGGTINDETIDTLQCKIVAGGANNQLADEDRHGDLLRARGILYAPDYVINAGGLINIYVREILIEPDPLLWIRKIEASLTEIFATAKRKNISPARAANEIVEDKLK